MGKLDIMWLSNFGEKGRLQSSQLQRLIQPQGMPVLTNEIIAFVITILLILIFDNSDLQIVKLQRTFSFLSLYNVYYNVYYKFIMYIIYLLLRRGVDGFSSEYATLHYIK